MITENQILVELQKINQQLGKQKPSFIKNFFLGMASSLGAFFGYIIIVAIIAYFASQFDWASMISQSMETMMSQINWAKIITIPKI
jgi:hypothetical protein